jgi:hypothetical protein
MGIETPADGGREEARAISEVALLDLADDIGSGTGTEVGDLSIMALEVPEECNDELV